MGKNAFVTLATSDEYAIGALVLAESIQSVGTSADIVILITTGVSEELRETLTSVFTKVIQITELNSENKEILDLINRPELSVTISKINAWQLTDYEKCVFIDADCLVIKSIDELFDKPELSAVCDLGWPDCFNSGVFVFKPSLETYNGLLKLLKAEDSFDGGDQGLLNVYFSDWIDSDINKRLSFIYNMHSSAAYTYLPAFRRFGERVKVIHFLGAIKPWMYNFNKSTNEITSTYCATHNMSHVQSWWNIFIEKIKDKLPKNLTNICLPEGLCDYFDLVRESPIEEEYLDTEEDFKNTEEEMENIEEKSGIAGQLSELEIPKQDDDFHRKKQWEAGNIDYLGKDSFDNIQKKLEESIGKL